MATDGTDTSPNDVEGGGSSALRPMEALDSDQIRNADGDEVVDPPEGWSEADKLTVTPEGELDGESLERKLNAEEPDPALEVADPAAAPVPERLDQTDGVSPDVADSLSEVVSTDVAQLEPDLTGEVPTRGAGDPAADPAVDAAVDALLDEQISAGPGAESAGLAGDDEVETVDVADMDQLTADETGGLSLGQVSGTPEDGDSIFPVVT